MVPRRAVQLVSSYPCGFTLWLLLSDATKHPTLNMLFATDSQLSAQLDGDGDAYGFLDISKDRQVEIKEVEEPVKRITAFTTKRGSEDAQSWSSEPGQLSAEIFGLQRCKRIRTVTQFLVADMALNVAQG